MKVTRKKSFPLAPPVTARQKVFSAVGMHANRLLVRAEKDDTARVLSLGIGIGLVGAAVENKGHNIISQLHRVAAWCIGWAESTPGFTGDVLALIHNERERQEQLFRTGEFNYTCASPTASGARKYRVLLEEGGEVAEAVDFLEDGETKNRREHLVTELIQTAAVAVAWLEALEAKEGK